MTMTRPNFVVGIGASAGGLSAYKSFFNALPPDTGMAFVVISHIHPAAHSELTQILIRHTQMPVMLAVSRMLVRANEVYVIPGNADLLLENGALVVNSPRSRRTAQVDIFFSSIAIDLGNRAVGIVFSGYFNDGSAGCQRIKAAGGTTFAQDATAEVSNMPLNARATGSVDFVLPPDEMPAELQKMIGRLVNSVQSKTTSLKGVKDKKHSGAKPESLL